ncbi:MAG: DUF2442 domain-containing protein [Acidimicrobiia bacterium]|nr:DUF2442 domain-containing protein [Acidimicrobiia bacterium]MCY4434115.1 DUF2442 domain-containing protein [bacterium]
MLSPHVVELEVQEPYKLWLRFDDGTTGTVDLSDSVALGGIFAAWTDPDFWRSAHIVFESGAVAWGDGTEVDICPQSLYLDVTGQTFDEAVRDDNEGGQADDEFQERIAASKARHQRILGRLAESGTVDRSRQVSGQVGMRNRKLRSV